jgi:hypothetical protein
MGRVHRQTGMAGLLELRLDPAGRMEGESMEKSMTLFWIATIGFTFFVGQPNWAELDTAGVTWTVHYITSTEEN